MALLIYDLKISEDIQSDSEISAVALVDEPAIQKDFIAFRNDFVQPQKNEKKDEFLKRCIKYVIDEGKDSEQAVAICNSMWEQHFASERISFDFDGTLSTSKGKELAKKMIDEGNQVYIISARHSKDELLSVAKDLGIPSENVFATGSNEEKIKKIKELNISKHYDNNIDVINQLGNVGQKFRLNTFEKFQILNEEQHIISGPLMLSDTLIYRNNQRFGEHYVKFSSDTIKKIAIKFSKKKYQSNVNLMHNESQQVDGVTMFESWIVDKNRGIFPMNGFEEVPDGSWFGSFYVENDEVWQQIKDGTLKGFSVEGMFEYDQPIQSDEYALEKIGKLLNELYED